MTVYYSDDTTGISVEGAEGGKPGPVVIIKTPTTRGDAPWFTEAEANAAFVGLLRWKAKTKPTDIIRLVLLAKELDEAEDRTRTLSKNRPQ